MKKLKRIVRTIRRIENGEAKTSVYLEYLMKRGKGFKIKQVRSYAITKLKIHNLFKEAGYIPS